MAIKDLLVAYDGSASADAALKLGALMAGKHGAKLTGLLAHGAAEQYAANARWIGSETRKVIDTANAAALEEAREQFSAQAAAANLEGVTLLDETGRPDLVVADYAKYYDLTLIGRFSGEATDARLILHPDRIALKSGRPLIVVPETFDRQTVPGQKVMVAWGGGRSATRALADALQILDNGAQVTLVTIGDDEQAAPGRNIETHLASHGVGVDWARLEQTSDVGEALLAFAESHAPDMMVMGAFEHSKFREDFFGGVTDSVLRRTKVPVLISH